MAVSGDTLENAGGEAASYVTSAMIGWFAGMGTALPILVIILALDMGDFDAWLFVSMLPTIFGITFFAGVVAGLPVAALFGVLMAVAERVSAHARALPAWLAGGLVATTPLAMLFWADSGGDWAPTQFSVLPLAIVYTIGLVAAGAAWWVRYRSWKL
jgi:hypothetical protein